MERSDMRVKIVISDDRVTFDPLFDVRKEIKLAPQDRKAVIDFFLSMKKELVGKGLPLDVKVE